MTSLLFLVEFAVRALLMAAGTGIILWILQIRSASVRHAAWTAVVVAMLLLPLSVAGGMQVALPVLEPAVELTGAEPGSASASRAFSAGLAEVPDALPAPPSDDSTRLVLEWPVLLGSLYLGVALVLLLRLVIGTVQANRLRRRAMMRDGRLTTDQCATPITVGWLRPELILPDGWQRWPAAKLDAVLTHELEHARRRDPLVQWLTLLNRAVFWFHPLAWWLERQVATLAEEACDAAVLAAGHTPREYSEYLINMARSVSRAGRRIQPVGVAMPGRSLTYRVRQIFQGAPLTPASRAHLISTVALCALSSVAFAAGQLAERTDVTSGQAGATSPAPTPDDQVQAPSAPKESRQTFDVASIKPCVTQTLPTTQQGGRVAGPGNATTSPGRAHWACVTLRELVRTAYAGADLRLSHSQTQRRPGDPEIIRGGPSWIDSEKFTVEARAAGDADRLTMIGPMLRALLEDRFQLRSHLAREERPLYALTVAKSGLKIKRTTPDDCKSDGGPKPCGNLNMDWNGGNRKLTMTGFTLKDVAERFLSSQLMDRFVIDETAVEGQFNLQFEFAPDDSTPGGAAALSWARRPGAERPTAPSIFRAFEEQLGLKIVSTKGQVEYLVIDSVQRPKPDLP